MESFTRHTGLVALMDRVNVDTDQIIPKQFLKRIERSGFGQFLFYDWRFNEDGSLNTDFELNQPRRGRFDSCGAGQFWLRLFARARAVGFARLRISLIIAPSFADIFYNNCFKNGILPVQL